MSRMYTADAEQQALSFLRSQLTYIEGPAVKKKYPDVQYRNLLPINTSAPEWVKSITYTTSDQFGRASWFNHMAKDIPFADVTRDQHEKTVELAGIGYRYTVEEIEQAMMVPGTNLQSDRAEAARRAYEEFVDNIALRGDTAKGWTGLLNDPDVPVAIVAADSASETGSTAWSDKTADQVLRDVNEAISGMYIDTLTIEMADTLLVPISIFTSIATRRLGDTPLTILEFLMKHNVYTAQTKQQLNITAVRGLETAGTGSTGRMIAYRNEASVLTMHIPMTHKFLPPWKTAPLTFDVPGIFRLGGVEIKRPQAVRYIDGILDAAYE